MPLSDFINKIHNENCLVTLSKMKDNSIDCCITSPPYFGLRNYQHEEQIGMEETPELFVQKLVEVFREVKRVLKPEGTLWLNLGDSYCGSTSETKSITEGTIIAKGTAEAQNNRAGRGARTTAMKMSGIKPKDLIGIPWMVAFALRADGWYLRQDIIWSKPNPMPESVTDRCTKSHEYIFLLSKSAKYYYDADAIKTPIADASIQRLLQDVEKQEGSARVPGKTNGNMKAVGSKRKYTDQDVIGKKLSQHSGGFYTDGSIVGNGMANKKSVWTVTTKPFSEAHFATFPPRLIVPCVLAGCPKGGIIYDPFGGAATTALVALDHGRNFILSELNPEYCKIGRKRIQPFMNLIKF